MNKTVKRSALIIGFVVLTTMTATPAFADHTPGHTPGWSNGQAAQVGPPGQSVRPDIDERFEATITRIIDRLEALQDRIGGRNPQVNLSLQSLIDRLTGWIS